MIELRPYQHKIIDKTRNELGKNRAVILCSPTGSGKTIMFTYIAKSSFEKGKKVLILTNRAELLTQTGNSFNRFSLPHGNITADTKHMPNNQVVIAMVETLKRRVTLPQWVEMLQTIDLLIVDECHLASHDAIVSAMPATCYILGATATPMRYDKRNMLAKYYQSIVNELQPKQLIALGFLAKPKYYGIEADLSDAKFSKGEFENDYLTQKFTSKKIYTGLKTNISLFCRKKCLFFASNIKSSISLYNELLSLKEESLKCVFYIDGNTPEKERNEIIAKYAVTPEAWLVNCGVLTTGFDCPSVDVVVLMRATTSLVLFLQMVGRAARTTENKSTFTVIDFGNNINRHGFWHDDRDWKLEIENKKPKEIGVANIKYCKHCNAIVSQAAKVCEYCGFVFPIKKAEIIDVQLTELTEEKARNMLAATSRVLQIEKQRTDMNYKVGWVLRQLKTYNDFIAYEKIKGYKNGWANHIFKL